MRPAQNPGTLARPRTEQNRTDDQSGAPAAPPAAASCTGTSRPQCGAGTRTQRRPGSAARDATPQAHAQQPQHEPGLAPCARWTARRRLRTVLVPSRRARRTRWSAARACREDPPTSSCRARLPRSPRRTRRSRPCARTDVKHPANRHARTQGEHEDQHTLSDVQQSLKGTQAHLQRLQRGRRSNSAPAVWHTRQFARSSSLMVSRMFTCGRHNPSLTCPPRMQSPGTRAWDRTTCITVASWHWYDAGERSSSTRCKDDKAHTGARV